MYLFYIPFEFLFRAATFCICLEYRLLNKSLLGIQHSTQDEKLFVNSHFKWILNRFRTNPESIHGCAARRHPSLYR